MVLALSIVLTTWVAVLADLATLEMVESDLAGLEALPANISNDSVDSEADANNDSVASMGLEHGSAIKEIFQATQQLSHQDRVDAADERRRSQNLLDFILSHRFSAQAINEFVSKGTISRIINNHDMFDKSSLRTSSVSPVIPSGGLTAVHSKISLGNKGVFSPPNVNCVVSGLEEGELPCSSSTSPKRKQSLSSIVAQGEPKSCLKLEYHPPSHSSADGSITIKPPTEVLLKGNSLWNSLFLDCLLSLLKRLLINYGISIVF